MLEFITRNLANFVIGALLLAAVAGIVASLVRRRKSGKPLGCGCGCEGCPSASACHGAKGT